MSRGEKIIAPYYVDSVTRSFQAIARVLFEMPEKIVHALDMLTKMNVEAPKPFARYVCHQQSARSQSAGAGQIGARGFACQARFHDSRLSAAND
ncbi:MAG: hypothetical protein ACI915_002636 [Gammaproteobacteria bacterium]|jgi:hypothetical protein